MNTNSRLGRIPACLCGALLLALGHAAHAQYMPTSPESEMTPKNYSLVDANGVDLAERSFNTGHQVSIGDPQNGGLSYSVNYSSSGIWKFWQSVFAYVRWDVIQDPEVGYEYHVFALQFEGKTEQLYPTEIGGVYTGDRASKMVWCSAGACVSSVTLADGTVLAFEPVGQSVSYSGTIFRVTTVTRPNGDVTQFHYTPGLAIQSITNNHGYQLRFNFTNPSAPNLPDPTSVVLFNMAVDACNPSAATCPAFSRTWPSLTFERTNSRVSAVTDAAGTRTEYTYDAQWQRVTNVNGPGTDDVAITYQYCGGNPPAGQCNAGGFSQYVGGYRVSTITRGGRTWTYTWDPSLVQPANSERGVRVTTPIGWVGYRTAVPPQAGYAAYDMYAFAPVMLSVRDQLGRITKYEYLGQLNPKVSKVTHPEGDGLEYTYDMRMNLTAVKRFAKTGTGQPTVTLTTITRGEGPTVWNCVQPAYCNKPIRIRDARQYVQQYDWNPTTGLLMSVVNGLEGPDNNLTCALGANLCPKIEYGYTAQSAYYLNASGQLIAGSAIQMPTTTSQCEDLSNCAASEKVVATLGYGPAGAPRNLLMRTLSVGKGTTTRTASYEYDAVGNRTELDGPRTDVADVTRFTYGLDRRPIDTVQADGSATRTTYTPEGWVATVSRGTSSAPGQFTALETTTNNYDAIGKLIRVTTPAGITQMSYDSDLRLTCTAVRMNPAVYVSLPVDACQPHTAGPDGADRITRNVYDAAGRVTTIQRGYLTISQIDYVTQDYTPNGKIDWVRDANGNRTDYTYDAYDRLSRTDFPSVTLGANTPNTADYEIYGYDAADNRTSVRLRSSETVTHVFDALNRKTRQDLPGGDTLDVFFTYDLMSRRRTATHGSPTGAGVSNTYDAWNKRLTETSYGRTLTFAYDPAGNRTRITWPDGNYTEYTYDAVNRMDQVRENGATAGPGLIADYGYDSLGRRSTITRGNGAATGYGYDGASRLTSLTQDVAGTFQDLTLGYSYNVAGQILGRTMSNDMYRFRPQSPANEAYVRDGLNRYTSVAGVPHANDARGNMTGDGARAYVYDLDNRLTRVDAAGGSPTLLSLAYDPLGRLRQTSNATSTTQFLYDGGSLVAEYNGSSAVPSRRYVHGAKTDEPIAWYEGSGFTNARRLLADHQGSIVASTGASGAVSAYAYGPYGEPANAWGGARFRFTGQIALPEVMLYHYRARMYSPRLGRFLQTDPIGYKDDYDLYTYVGNDPLNNVDPTGLSCKRIHDQSQTCQVDSMKNKDGSVTLRKDFTPAQKEAVKKYEAGYTKAVNDLEKSAKSGNGTATLEGPNGKSITVKAGKAAEALANAEVKVDMNSKGAMNSGSSTIDVGTASLVAPTRLDGVPVGLSRENLYSVTFAHEGIHLAYVYSRNMWADLGDAWWHAHQGSFNKAAAGMLNLK